MHEQKSQAQKISTFHSPPCLPRCAAPFQRKQNMRRKTFPNQHAVRSATTCNKTKKPSLAIQSHSRDLRKIQTKIPLQQKREEKEEIQTTITLGYPARAHIVDMQQKMRMYDLEHNTGNRGRDVRNWGGVMRSLPETTREGNFEKKADIPY